MVDVGVTEYAGEIDESVGCTYNVCDEQHAVSHPVITLAGRVASAHLECGRAVKRRKRSAVEIGYCWTLEKRHCLGRRVVVAESVAEAC